MRKLANPRLFSAARRFRAEWEREDRLHALADAAQWRVSRAMDRFVGLMRPLLGEENVGTHRAVAFVIEGRVYVASLSPSAREGDGSRAIDWDDYEAVFIEEDLTDG